MRNFYSMSRTELVCELLAPSHPASVSEVAASYQPEEATLPFPHGAPASMLVSYKLSIAREILQRDLLAQMQTGPILNSPWIVKEWLKMHCAEWTHEVFMVFHLNVRGQLIVVEDMFRGTLASTKVYPREVVKAALHHNSSSILVAHNHPSGDLSPSLADRYITTDLKAALALVDVRFDDHFIVGGNGVYSFAENGLM